jgi:hypothetical protein
MDLKDAASGRGRVSAGDFRDALETSTLSSLSVDIVAILSGMNTFVDANELG